MKNISSAHVHFYRAAVMHSDVWRRRLDITTNWSVVSTAGVATYAFSSSDTPHVAVLISIPFIFFFMLMESRRYQVYDLWRHRVRILNRFFIAPALSPDTAPSDEEINAEMAALASALGSNIPRLALIDAMGYRLRRNYGLLLFGVLAMWGLKLWAHPGAPEGLVEFVGRAGVYSIPGWFSILVVLVFYGVCAFLIFRAPTEDIVGWVEVPSALERLRGDGPGQDVSILSERFESVDASESE